MAWTIEIDSVDRYADIDQASSVNIDLQFDERGTARFTTRPGYVPGLHDEVIIYDQDGTTPIFGGVIFSRRTLGFKDIHKTECECVDWTWYLDNLTIAGGVLTGTITLKQVLEWLQANYFAPYGFVLDAAQVTGPSATVTGFAWERKYASDVLRDLTMWSGGWIFQVDPDKTWRMVKPSLGTPTAPFTITDSNATARELNWEENSENYATKVIVVFGGTGTREKTEAFEVDAQIVTDGYYDTEIKAAPLNAPSATINASPASIGGPGSQLLWSFGGGVNGVARVTAGTYVPNLGDDITVTYTAQYPGEAVADSLASPVIERTEARDDITDLATAQAVADGLLAASFQSSRTYSVDTVTPGLWPGQVVSINLNARSAAATSALIIRLGIQLVLNETWIYRATAINGVYYGSNYGFFRGGGNGGGSGGVTITYTGGVNPVVGEPVTSLASIAALTNRIPYANGVDGYQSSANLTFDGTTLTVSGGTTSLANGTSNLIVWGGTSIGAPTFSTRSAGSKLVLFPQIDASNVDYALGIEAGALWSSVPQANASHFHKWYGGTSELMQLSGVGDLGHPSYASQTSNWRITGAGAADFRYLFTDEMHAKSFIADLEQALAGGQIIAKSVAMVAQPFTAPSAGNSTTLWVRDLPSAPNMAAFENGDRVVLRTFSRSGGALTIADCVGAVSSYTDGTGANEGTQSWSFLRESGGNAGTMTASTVVAVDSIVIDYGISGNGYYEVNAIDGTYGANSPYVQTVTWTTAPVAANRSIRTRMGNLSGAYGYSGGSNIFGFAAGDPSAANITIEPTNGIRIRHGTTNKLTADTSGNLNLVGDLVMGTAGVIRSGATAFGTGTGYWLAHNSGTPQMRVGVPSGDRVSWDGTDLTVVSSNLTIGSNGVEITPQSVIDDTRSYRFSNPSGDTGAFGFYGATGGSGSKSLIIRGLANSGTVASRTSTAQMLALYHNSIGGEQGVSLGIFSGGTSSGVTDRFQVVISDEGVGSSTFTHTASLFQVSHLAGAGTVAANLDANGNFVRSSDARLKRDVTDYAHGLAAVRQLRPVSYRWTSQSGYETEATNIGFLAQEVGQALPMSAGPGPDGRWSYSDKAIIGALVNAVKEIEAELDHLKRSLV